MVNAFLATADVEAALVECALNIVESIPAAKSTSHIHQVIVVFATGAVWSLEG